MNLHGSIVKEGKWNYNGTSLKIQITLDQVYRGSYDDDDPDELRFDRNEPTYYLWYEQTGRTDYVGGGQFSSLEDAVAEAEKKVLPQKVDWSDQYAK